MRNRILVSVLRSVAAVVLAVACAATVLLTCLQFGVYDERVFRDIPEDPTFVEKMQNTVLDVVEHDCTSVCGIPFEVLKPTVTADRVGTWAKQYCDKLYDSLRTGQKVSDFTIDPAPYRDAIVAYFESVPEADRDEEFPTDAAEIAEIAEENASELARSTASVFEAGFPKKVFDYGHRLLYGDTLLRKAAAFWPLCALAMLVLIAVCLLPWRAWRSRVYGAAGALFVGSALVYVPLQLLQRHDLARDIKWGQSPTRWYMEGILNGTIDRMTAIALGVFIVAAVLLVAAVVVTVWPKKASAKEKTEEIVG